MKNLLLLTAFALLWAGVSTAQETASNTLPEETAARFEMALMEIGAKKDDVASLTQRADSSEGLMAELLLQRRDSLWIDIFRDTMALAKDVAAEVEAGRLTKDQLNQSYCRLVFEQLGNYQLAAERLGVDWRTVRRHANVKS